ncbi:MAG: hypothetical protein ACLUKN_10390 [Bacilli bacterium]
MLAPIAVNREGKIFRMNSDLLACETAWTGRKQAYIPDRNARAHARRRKSGGRTDNEVRELLDERINDIDPRVVSKVRCAVKAFESTRTQRAHILMGESSPAFDGAF